MSPATILLVDDDEVLRQVLRRVLMRDGYTVVEAGSVAQALERGREQPPALGLIDLRLPDGDGVELAHRLQTQVGRFPLILMTAYPLRLRDQPELAKGFAHVLTKPLNLDELRQAIETSLGAAAPARTASLERSRLHMSGSRSSRFACRNQRRRVSLPLRRRGRRRNARRWGWPAVAGVVVIVAGLAVAVPALGVPGIQRLFKPSETRLSIPRPRFRAQLVSGNEEEIELPREVVDRLGVTSDPVRAAAAPSPLELAGSLSFDPNHLGRVQARFGGEVVAIGTTSQPGPDGSNARTSPPLRRPRHQRASAGRRSQQGSWREEERTGRFVGPAVV